MVAIQYLGMSGGAALYIEGAKRPHNDWLITSTVVQAYDKACGIIDDLEHGRLTQADLDKLARRARERVVVDDLSPSEQHDLNTVLFSGYNN